MERKDVMSKNVAIYKGQASALEKGAAPGCKVRSGSGFCWPAGPPAPQDLPQAIRHLLASPTIYLPRPGLALPPVPAPLPAPMGRQDSVVFDESKNWRCAACTYAFNEIAKVRFACVFVIFQRHDVCAAGPCRWTHGW